MKNWVWLSIGLVISGYFSLKSAGIRFSSSSPTYAVPENEDGNGIRSSTSAASSAEPKSLSPGTQETALKIVSNLRSLLASFNDNSPKYDTEMRNLSPETKALMQTEYRKMSREKRNDRGTVVFLIGREIKTDSDLKFMEEVLTEEPCLSLSNCGKDSKEDAHADSESGAETTLVYPQIVAIKSLSEFAIQSREEKMKTDARILLERISKNHRSERIREEAKAALARTFRQM